MRRPVSHNPDCHCGRLSAWVPILAVALLCWCVGAAQAACDDATLLDAAKKYEIGCFEQVIGLLTPCLETTFSPPQRAEAYRLLALTWCAVDSTERARFAVENLLAINPGYEPNFFDPLKFIELVHQIRNASSAVMVTSVSKKTENIQQAPATVMVITAEEIRNRGYVDLDAFFSDLPGFDVSRPAAISYSNFYQRGYRANNIDRTLFFVDGHEQNDLWSNAIFNTRQFPISNVKRIEVVYGPASTMYGANALVGVVNVITKDPEQLCGDKPLSLSVNTGGGTYRTAYTDVTIAGRKNRVAASLTARLLRSDEMDLSGYPEYDYSSTYYDNIDYRKLLAIDSAHAAAFVKTNRIDAANRYFALRINSGGDTVGVQLTDAGVDSVRAWDRSIVGRTVNGSTVHYANQSRYWYVSGALKVADLKLGCEFWSSHQGATNYYNDNNEAGADNGDSWIPTEAFYYVNYEKVLSDKLSLMNTMQYRVNEINDQTKAVYMNTFANGALGAAAVLDSLNAASRPYWTTEYFYEISRQFRDELKMLWAPLRQLDFVSGLEVRNSSIQGDYRNTFFDDYQTTDPDTSQSAAEIGSSKGDKWPGGNDFTVYDLGIYSQATWRPASLLQATLGGRYDYNRIRTSGGYGSIFNPRIAIVCSPSRFILKLIYASAFQNASNWTKFSTSTTRSVPNPTLAPERVRNFELSLGVKLGEHLFADAVGYYAKYEDVVGTGIVGLADGSTTAQNQAIGELKIRGIQATMSWKYGDYSAYANYTYTDPRNAILEKGALTGSYQRVGDIAKHRFNLGASAQFLGHLGVHLRLNAVGSRPVGSGTSVPDNTRSFPAFALCNGTLTYARVLPGLDLQLICNNIFDREYFDPGVRSADGTFYADRIPQKRRNLCLRAMYDFN